MFARLSVIEVSADIPASAPLASSNLAMPHWRGIGKFGVTHFIECPSLLLLLLV